MKEFKFNDEFWLDTAPEEEVRKHYPRLWFALRIPALAEKFLKVDEGAMEEKARFRWFGVGAVALALLALLSAAIEPIFILPLAQKGGIPREVADYWALGAGALGVLSVLIGWAGMGIADRKRDWLSRRLYSERLRQWRWQYLTANLPALFAAADNEKRRANYLEERDRALERFFRDYDNLLGARFADHIASFPPHVKMLWINSELAQGAKKSPAAIEASPVEKDSEEDKLRDEFFRAYRNRRIKGQLDYVVYILGEDGKFRTHPRVQKRRIEVFGLLTVAIIATLHISIIVGIWLHVFALEHPAMYALTLGVALFALAARAIEEGLQPGEHIARLSAYLGDVSEAAEAFDDGGDAEKVRQMVEIEEAAGLELIEFLQAAKKSRYLL